MAAEQSLDQSLKHIEDVACVSSTATSSYCSPASSSVCSYDGCSSVCSSDGCSSVCSSEGSHSKCVLDGSSLLPDPEVASFVKQYCSDVSLLRSLDYSLKSCSGEVMIIGGAFVDVTLGIEHLPVHGGDMYAKELNVGLGGCATNVAHLLRQLNINHAIRVPIGNGSYAATVEKQLKADGYGDESFIYDRSMPNDCGYCLCMVDAQGERTFILVPGIEYYFKDEWLTNVDLSTCSMLYLVGFDITEDNGMVYMNKLKKDLNPNCTVFFDSGARIPFVTEQTWEALLEFNPILHLNRLELELITKHKDLKTALEIMAKKTSAPVILSLDKDGTVVSYQGKYYHFGITPQSVVDATGAGDSHCAGIIAALMQGYDLTKAIEAGNKIAAVAIKQVGARIDLPEGYELLG